MPSTKYKPGEIPGKVSRVAHDELQSRYHTRRRHFQTHIPSSPSCDHATKIGDDAISNARDPKRFVHTQNELFGLLEKAQSIDLGPSDEEAVNKLIDYARDRQLTADENSEQSLMDNQLDLREGRLLGDATCMSILGLVSGVSDDDPRDLCLTKAREYCTPSLPGKI